MSEIDLLALINEQPLGIAEFNADNGHYLFFNERERLFRCLTHRQMQAVCLFDLFDEGDRQTFKQRLKECLQAPIKQPYFFDYEKNQRHFQMRLIRSDNGSIMSTLSDTTDTHHLNASYRINQKYIQCLNDAVIAANIGCWDFYPQEQRIVANEAWVTQKKYKDKDFRVNDEMFADVIDGFARWTTLVHPDDLDATVELIEMHLKGDSDVYEAQFRMKSGDGEWIWIHDIGKVFQRDANGAAIRMNGVHLDITKARKLEAEIDRVSMTDPLTGLLNRRKFEALFDASLKATAKTKKIFGFLFLDVDYFKKYNDIYGHQAGDDLLIAVSKVLKQSLRRSGDHCFRLGGEEFGIVFNADDKQSAVSFSELVKKNIESLLIPHKTNTASKYVTVSMGLVTEQNYKVDDVGRIYKKADELLYKSKENGRNILSCN
ncbi:MAG: diguanylate cyclase (GGDEF)-like protein [Pseudohongiellaceae bacterium]|jgi:diguanylate cyclase (GGDEF)-like protein